MLRASNLAGDAGASDTTVDAKHDASNDRCVLLALASSGLSVFSLPEAGVIAIGRADGCPVQLRDPLVSRHHASLHVSPLAIEDHGSANGTWLGNTRLEPNKPVTLTEGQVLNVGSSMLIVRRSSGTASVHDTRSKPRSQAQPRVAFDERMVELYARAERLAASNIPLLVEGETGVGKNVLAELIHASSARSSGPFLRVDCAALGEPVLERELFGHERGAFAGAVSASRGLIETANGGTVFLDEVGELPLSLQAKLLRVLEAGEVSPVGSLRPRAVSVRFVAVTSQDLRAQADLGKFRADLLFRLNGASLSIPPLRERPQDVIPLATEFLRASAELGLLRAPEFTPDALTRLGAHPWPGNVRELRHAIERAILVCDGSRITASDLRLENRSLLEVAPASQKPHTEPELDTRASLALAADAGRRESPAQRRARERIQRALAECGGNQSRAAEHLGIPRRTLVRRIAQLRLPRPRSEG